MKHPVSVCSWSFQKPIRDVAEEMARLDVRHVHLALQPFLEGDARHGHAEDARTRGYVEGLIDAGAWTVSAAMLSPSLPEGAAPSFAAFSSCSRAPASDSAASQRASSSQQARVSVTPKHGVPTTAVRTCPSFAGSVITLTLS